MSWMKNLVRVIKPSRGNTLQYRTSEIGHSVIRYGEKGFSSAQLRGDNHFRGGMSWMSKLQCNLMQTIVRRRTISVQHAHSTNDPDMSRDFFIRLWNADRKKSKSSLSRRRKVLKSDGQGGTFLVRQPSYGLPERSFPDASVLNGKQPPTSQSFSGILEPTSSEESRVAPLLARSNLLITRDIEWANLVLGFEQQNRYAVVDVCYPQAPVGFIREESNPIARQVLRRRRPFIAFITDGLGNELFRIRRPFWWITSSIYAEINGKEIGVVHQRWHLWRRVYDLYLDNKQFAVVDNSGFWNWTFTLKDIDGNVLAEIDRDWRGIGFEIFTDAGQYVIRFGSANSGIIPAPEVQELNVTRPLTLSERAVAVALAVSLDNDYFSRHGRWGLPIMFIDD